MKNNPEFQKWVFHYNPYEELWFAIPRDSYNNFWNEKNTKGILKSKDLKVLLAIIDSDKIENYL